MMSRLPDLPILSAYPDEIPAEQYNRVRLALRRLPNPIRLRLEGLRHLDIIIDDDSWVCVDRVLNDMPVIAWTEFDTQHRAGLHEPVRCKLTYYHAYAGLVVKKALVALTHQLDALLAEKYPERGGVSPLERKA